MAHAITRPSQWHDHSRLSCYLSLEIFSILMNDSQAPRQRHAAGVVLTRMGQRCTLNRHAVYSVLFEINDIKSVQAMIRCHERNHEDIRKLSN